MKSRLLCYLLVVASINCYTQTWDDLIQTGQQQQGEGKAELAQKSFEKALSLAETGGKLTEQYGTTCYWLAINFHTRGRYEEAEPFYLKALDAIKASKGDTHTDYAAVANNLGSLYETIQQNWKAEQYYKIAITIREKLYGKTNEEYISSLSNLAALYGAQGRYAEALPLFRELAAIAEANHGEASKEYANAINTVGLIYYWLGDYTNAETFLLYGVKTLIKIKSQSNEYGNALNSLGVLYKTIGNYQKAVLFYNESAKIIRKISGEESEDFALSLNNIGMLNIEIGDYENALPFFTTAKEIAEKVIGEDHPFYALVISNEALVYQKLGLYDKAEPLFLKALSLRGKLQGKLHPDYATALNNLGCNYMALKKYAAATPPLTDALQITQTVFGKNHPNYSNDLANMARLHEEKGDIMNAETLYLEVINLKKREIARLFPVLSDKEKRAFYASNKFTFANFESFCLENHQSKLSLVGELYNLKLITKGLLLSASSQSRKLISESNDPLVLADFKKWQQKKDTLARFYKMSVEEKKKRNVQENVLEEEVNSLEKQLSVKSSTFANSFIEQQFTWEAVRQKLKPGEAAVEIIRSEKKINGEYKPIYAALIVTLLTRTHPEIVMLENGEMLENRYSKYYSNCINKKIKDELSYNQYWKPIAEKLAGVKKIYVSLDGVYNQLNLNTLLNPSTGKFLIEDLEIQIVANTRDLITTTSKGIYQIKNATLIGYPNYNIQQAFTSANDQPYNGEINTNEIKTDSASRFFTGESIAELPGTKVEIESIDLILKKKGVKVQQLISNSATEEELKKVNSPQVLHIATHGFFLSDLPAPSTGDRSIGGIETKILVENPLLRSGLLLAGAQSAFIGDGVTEGEDGVLTAFEAMNLNLSKTDLVVMSACETGLGVNSSGEGVYGLQRAFQIAGARSVLMSLWRVSDEATQLLMTSFYENWLSGKTTLEAFRVAQLSLRSKFPEPYYWGAFVITGN